MPEIKPSASLISFTRSAVEMDQEGLALPWQAGDLEMGAYFYLHSCSSQVWF